MVSMKDAAAGRYRRFLLGFLSALALSIAGMTAFNYVVDPFQYYRVATLYRPILWGGMQRYQNAGLARNFAEDEGGAGTGGLIDRLVEHGFRFLNGCGDVALLGSEARERQPGLGVERFQR